MMNAGSNNQRTALAVGGAIVLTAQDFVTSIWLLGGATGNLVGKMQTASSEVALPDVVAAALDGVGAASFGSGANLAAKVRWAGFRTYPNGGIALGGDLTDLSIHPKARPPDAGFIFAHGSGNALGATPFWASDDVPSSLWVHFSPREAVQIMRSYSGYRGGPVCMLACNTGDGSIAQDVANLIGDQVSAPQGTLIASVGHFKDGSSWVMAWRVEGYATSYMQPGTYMTLFSGGETPASNVQYLVGPLAGGQAVTNTLY